MAEWDLNFIFGKEPKKWTIAPNYEAKVQKAIIDYANIVQ